MVACLGVLSIKQPYAHLILRAKKRYEARGWRPVELGSLILHASTGYATGWKQNKAILAALAELGLTAADVDGLPRGAIVGTALVEHVIEPYRSGHSRLSKRQRMLCSDDGYTAANCLWRLGRVKPVDPIAIRGHLNLWLPPKRVLDRLAAGGFRPTRFERSYMRPT